MNFDFIYRDETRELNDDVRASTPGAFLRLSEGFTHYELSGPDSGPCVALVHGFSVPYFIFDPTFDFLVKSGFHVLRYDLFGRGFSDRPAAKYSLGFFVKQLKELLEALNLARVNLIGLSMGGAIASAFTVHHAERVEKLVLIDPVGVQSMPLSWLYKLAILPGVSELVLGLLGTERMIQGAASDFYDPEHVKMFQDQYRIQMQYRGFKRAILSTLRNKAVNGVPAVYQQLGKLELPILLFWGRNDQTLPLEQSRDLLSAVPRAEFHVMENCGHIPHYERPGDFNPMLLNFLKSI